MKKVIRVLAIILIVFSILLISFVYAEDVNVNAGLSDAQIQSQIRAGNGQNNEDGSNAEEDEEFCGTSTYGFCEGNDDCIRGGCSSQVCQSVNEESVITTCEWTECYDAVKYKARCVCLENQCQWITKKELTQAQLGEIIRERNRIRIQAGITVSAEECPENCTCTGSVIKCEIEGGREMTVIAGKSGNVIVQVKGENMTTNVTLYKSEGKVYGIFKGNETKEVILPDEARLKIEERLRARAEIRNMVLDEEGVYKIEAYKRSRLFWMISVQKRINANVDAETGEIIRMRVPWWSFLARDEKENSE